MKAIQNSNSSVTSFRDCTLNMLVDIQDNVDRNLFLRGKYVIEEMLRVESCVQALKANDLQSLGELMYQTHEGLSSDYQVSCPELDALVNKAREYPGVIGSRMMGGGFGGCTINLVKKGFEEDLVQDISDYYLSKFGRKPEPYFVRISDGTSLLDE